VHLPPLIFSHKSGGGVIGEQPVGIELSSQGQGFRLTEIEKTGFQPVGGFQNPVFL